jgi:hypothetical protein
VDSVDDVLGDDVLKNPLTVEDGRMVVQDEPRLATVNEEEVEECRIYRFSPMFADILSEGSVRTLYIKVGSIDVPVRAVGPRRPETITSSWSIADLKRYGLRASKKPTFEE